LTGWTRTLKREGKKGIRGGGKTFRVPKSVSIEGKRRSSLEGASIAEDRVVPHQPEGGLGRLQNEYLGWILLSSYWKEFIRIGKKRRRGRGGSQVQKKKQCRGKNVLLA